MKVAHALQLAGVPQELPASALASLEKAQKASKGTTLAKWKVRLFKTKRIARLFLPSGEQSWYPIAGHELRAPVS